MRSFSTDVDPQEPQEVKTRVCNCVCVVREYVRACTYVCVCVCVCVCVWCV